MTEASKTLLAIILDRVFPKMPDFFHMLTEQNLKVAHTVNLLVEYMEYGDPVIAEALKLDVHEADGIKVRNLHELNEAFSTPIDREDIYRAIMSLDDIVMYCKTTVHEMDVLGVKPDNFMRDISRRIKDGVDALQRLCQAWHYTCQRRTGRRRGAQSRAPCREAVTRGFAHAVRGRRLHQHVQAPRDLPPLDECRRAYGAMRQHAARHRS